MKYDEQEVFNMTAYSVEVRPKKAWITVDDVLLYKREIDKQIAKLEAERDRYREALQTIAAECEIEFQYAADVANTALEE